MAIWGWIAIIVGGAGIIVLLVTGDGDREFSGRDREALVEGPPQALISAPAAIGAEQAMTIVVAREDAPPEVAPALEEVRQLLQTAADQPPELAKPTLEQAKTTLSDAIEQIGETANETDNDVTRIRLIRLVLVLHRVEEMIQAKLDQL